MMAVQRRLQFHCTSFFLGLLFCCMGVSAGCKQSPATATVTGRVTLDGKPVTTGSVVTLPKSGRGAKGVIRPDGTFELGTFKIDDGALLGTHKVAVVAYEPPAKPGPEAANGKLLVPQRYVNPDTSGLTIDVTAGENNPELKLASP